MFVRGRIPLKQYNLRSLQIFESVFRNRSIRLAAEELLITPSAISHQLRHLRIELGEDLVEKTGKAMAFTPYGTRLAESLNYAFSNIDSTVRNTIGCEPKSLRIGVCTAFGLGWLVPRLAQYPKLAGSNIQLKLDTKHPDLTDRVADIFFSTTSSKEGFTSVKILPENLVAVHSPILRDSKSKAAALITTDIENDNFAEDWSDYSVSIQRQEELAGTYYLGASHYAFAAEMAERGLGIALVPEFLAEDGIRHNRLVAWSTYRMSTGRSYYMHIKYARRNEQPIRDFVCWVRSCVADLDIETLAKRRPNGNEQPTSNSNLLPTGRR